MILCHVKDLNSKVYTLESIPIVNEISDVFTNEIPGISPKREIDLGLRCSRALNQFQKFHIEWHPKL